MATTQPSSSNANLTTRRLASLVCVIAAFSLIPSRAVAQCPGEWRATPGVSGATPNVRALATWDPDGAGPQPAVLVVGGSFDVAGTESANNIATWDGTTWSPLGSGTNAEVDALAVLSNGDLVAAGLFTNAGGVSANYIARWDGQAWHALGAGIGSQVYALTKMPNGDLVAGGNFITAGGLAANGVARWNGSSWSPFGTGVGGIVYSLTVLTNGDLIAGGSFLMAGTTTVRYIARWTGSAWQGIGGGMNAAVLAVTGMPNGDLIASGIFSQRIGRFDGTAWQTLGTGLNAQALVLLPIGDTEFIAGGHFSSAGGLSANKIARWDGSSWHALGTGLDQYVIALAAMPTGELAVGGGFTAAGGIPSPYLALWAIPGAPVVTQQPQSLATCPLGNATFSVTATGDSPLTWKWQAELDPGVWTDLTDGDLVHNAIVLATVSGATLDTIQFTSLGHFNEDRNLLGLRCTVINACGDATTNVVNLTVAATCLGDLTCDGIVDLTDLALLLSNYGRDPIPPVQGSGGDIDGDGDVDLSDLATLLSAYGTICP